MGEERGRHYEANETLAEVDTDKATMEMTALTGGTLLKILKGEGETAALGEAIAITGNKGEDISALLKEASGNGQKSEPPAEKPAEAPKAETRVVASGPAPTPATSTAPAATRKDAQPQQQTNGRMIVSPIAARMAADNGIDLRSVAGTGPNGRIIKRDIEAAMCRGSDTAARAFTPSTVIGASPFRDENTSKMRQVIASRLVESIGPVPTFYLTVEIEMDNTLAVRKQINANLSTKRRSASTTSS